MADKIDLRPLDTILAPDQWPEIRERRAHVPAFTDRPSRSTMPRVVTIAAALVIAAAACALLFTTFSDRDHGPLGTTTPTVAPASSELVAFVTPHFRIAVVNPDGSDERVLTTGDEGGASGEAGSMPVLDESPQWAADGSTILFIRVVRDSSWLCSIRVDGSGFRVITKDLGGAHIVMSPDGSRLAYDGMDGQLHLIDTDGAAVDIPPLHVDGSVMFIWGPDRPAWSPDGSEIAAAGPADGTGRCGNDGCALWVLNLETGTSVDLTADVPTQKVVSVVWAPSDRIVYASVDLSGADGPPLKLWAINADGSGRRQLPSDGATVPVGYSPDGASLLVGRYGAFPYVDDRGLFIDDGGAYRPIVSGAVSSFGDWG